MLKRSKTEPHTYYTPDELFKISRATVRAYGWDILKKDDRGEYRVEAHAATLQEARHLVG